MAVLVVVAAVLAACTSTAPDIVRPGRGPHPDHDLARDRQRHRRRTSGGGHLLTFAATGDERFTDAQTGSTWDVLGRALDGPLAGTQLRQVSHLDTFWFAWAAFRPQTRMIS